MKRPYGLVATLLVAILLVAAPLAAAPATAPGGAKAPAASTPPAKGAAPTTSTTPAKGAAPADTKAAKPATPPPEFLSKPVQLPPEPPPLSKTPPPGIVDPGEEGKIVYKDQPTSIVAIFMMHRQNQVELKYLADKEKAYRGRLDEIQRFQALARKELQNEEAPIRVEMVKQRNKEREIRKILSESQPKQPQMIQMPPPPRQSSSSYSGTSGNSSGNQYQSDLARWQADCQRIQQQNQTNMKKYQEDMKEFKAKQDKARKDIADLAAKIKELDAKLDALDKDFDTRQTDTVAAAKSINDQLQSIARQVTVVTNRQETLADTILGAPENIRLKAGIVEWEDALYAIGELKARYNETQGEIDKVHAQLKEDAEKAGRTFAADWRHPQQDRMDALKALLEKVKAAQAAASGPATSAKTAKSAK